MCKMAGFVVWVFFFPSSFLLLYQRAAPFHNSVCVRRTNKKIQHGSLHLFFLSKCCFSIPVFEFDRYFIKIEKLLVVAGN